MAAESGDALAFRNSMPYADPDREDEAEPVAVLPAEAMPAKITPFANKSRDVSHLEHQLDEEERGGTVTNQSLEQSGQQTNQRRPSDRSGQGPIYNIMTYHQGISEGPATME